MLVEPIRGITLSQQAKRDLVEEIWPTIEDSNKRCQHHAQVSKAKVLIASESMPFLRSSKGTVQRQTTLTLYKDIIDRLYDEDSLGDHSFSKNTQEVSHRISKDEATALVREIAQGLNGGVVSDDTNFFAVGMDSLQAIHFCRALAKKFPRLPITITAIYSNPTVNSLTDSVTQSFAHDSASQLQGSEVAGALHAYQLKIDALLQERNLTSGNTATNAISSGINGSCSTEARDTSSGFANSALHKGGSILLTGSTGALGSHILNSLLELGSQRIYCLNRPPGSRSLQISRNERRGLPTTFPDCRVIFLSGDLALPKFGLSAPEFEDLQESVTHVIHNAWPVNFNSSLQSFTNSLDGVQNLVRFANYSNQQVTLQLISSIASVARYSKTSAIPETIILDPNVTTSMGYGQSKYIAERILAYASEKLGIKTTSVRVGQISGDASRKCGWNIQEWFPSLVISSFHMRVLPDALGQADNDEIVRWTPVDSVAKVILELSKWQPSEKANTTFHILHPEPTPWSVLFPTVKGVLDQLASERGGPLIKVIPYHEWLAELRTQFDIDFIDANAVTANPALKLLPFFESLLSGPDFKSTFELGRSMAASSTMRTLQPLDKDCLQGWINGWMKEAGL